MKALARVLGGRDAELAGRAAASAEAVWRAAVPHLLEAENPHVLNLAPPVNLDPRWFRDHVAYTMAKYGMSMCVLGMAEEFSADAIAFGRPYISNPDLVERFANGWPLAEDAPMDVWYMPVMIPLRHGAQTPAVVNACE